ncbi:phosphatase PAP2 family protein [Humibacter sp.]|uniref:phosphatase PAP2 family protein n=1 Tax=Humibacter sp. TaxID=1940291 RepID=UPI003F80CBEE
MTQVAAPRSTVLLSLAVVACFAAAFAVVYAAMILTRAGQEIDDGSFGALGVIGIPLGATSGVIRSGGAFLLAIGALSAGASALIRRRWNDALRAALVVTLSTVGCEVLKTVLPRPDLHVGGYGDNTFPSGHMAVAFSAALAVTLTFPVNRWRRLVIITSLSLAIGTGWASVISFAHRPSDVIGAGLLVGACFAAVQVGRPLVIPALRGPLTALACSVAASIAAILFGRWLSTYTSTLGDPVEALGWLALCAAPVAGVLLVVPVMRRH